MQRGNDENTPVPNLGSGLTAGDTFGRYHLLESLGAGGMAEVFRCEVQGPSGFARQMAIKVLHSHLINDPLFPTLFQSEARLGGQLSHPNLVTTLDFGEQEGRLFLVMEFVDGTTLHNLLTYHRANELQLPVSVALEIILQVCQGLGYAHEATDRSGKPLRLIHRDIKPSNILIDRFGMVKLADFGVARATSNLIATQANSAFKGTLQYMAPEQADASPKVDHRADLFAIGLVLYEILTLKRVYDSESTTAVFRRVLAGDVRTQVADLPDLSRGELFAIISKTLRLDPAERYQSCRELASDLEAVAERLADKTGLRKWVSHLDPLAFVNDPPRSSPTPRQGPSFGPQFGGAASGTGVESTFSAGGVSQLFVWPQSEVAGLPAPQEPAKANLADLSPSRAAPSMGNATDPELENTAVMRRQDLRESAAKAAPARGSAEKVLLSAEPVPGKDTAPSGLEGEMGDGIAPMREAIPSSPRNPPQPSPVIAATPGADEGTPSHTAPRPKISRLAPPAPSAPSSSEPEMPLGLPVVSVTAPRVPATESLPLLPPELSPPELAPPELAPPRISPAEISPPELLPAEISPAEISPAEISRSDLATPELEMSSWSVSGEGYAPPADPPYPASSELAAVPSSLEPSEVPGWQATELGMASTHEVPRRSFLREHLLIILLGVVSLGITGAMVSTQWSEIQRLLLGRSAHLAVLTADSSPEGATLRAQSGAVVGTTPFHGSILIPDDGVLELVASLRGYEDSPPQKVLLEPGGRVSVTFELKRAPSAMGKVRIVTDPPGAEVSVDGEPRGTAPLEVLGLDIDKEHALSAGLPGQATAERSFKVEADRILEVFLEVPSNKKRKGGERP